MPVVSTCGEVDWSIERRRRAVDRIVFLRLNRPALVHRVAGHIEHAAHDALADGHGDGPAGVR